MSQGKRNYHTIASGWLKQGKKGEYISAAVNNKLKMTIETEDGQKLAITNFAVFFQDEKSSEKAPDVRFVFTTEE